MVKINDVFVMIIVLTSVLNKASAEIRIPNSINLKNEASGSSFLTKSDCFLSFLEEKNISVFEVVLVLFGLFWFEFIIVILLSRLIKKSPIQQIDGLERNFTVNFLTSRKPVISNFSI